MARIKINDLPKNMKISKEEMKKVIGGTLRISLDQTDPKTTTGTSFEDIADSGLTKDANVMISAGQTVASFIPGGSVLSAAISGVGQNTDGSSGSVSA